MLRTLTVLLGSLVVANALAQTTQPSTTAIDACGVLVQGARCVLFEGSGGKYVLSDYGRFKAGDAVRVVGTVDTNCATMCSDADGCVRGAVVYDPATYPCGTHIPSFPNDLVTGLCTAASAALLTVTLVGCHITRRK
jgi:hypothetical protein